MPVARSAPKSPLSDVVEVVEVDGFRFHHVAIAGVVLVEPNVHGDERGFFLETYHRPRYVRGGIAEVFVQDNHSRSKRGTLRGLHTQVEHLQGKLLRAVEGEIFDVAVDARGGSPTHGRWYGAVLSAENFRQLYIPPGFLHGFCVLSTSAQVEYKCTDVYDKSAERSVRWNDPDVGIDWPVKDPLLSERDRHAMSFAEAREELAACAPFPRE